jgi:tRNA U38,U39,U40 pseudouridine synthase TruA
VAVLLEVGRGSIDAERVAGLLAARKPALDGVIAPPQGLCLRRVVLGRRPNTASAEDDDGAAEER